MHLLQQEAAAAAPQQHCQQQQQQQAAEPAAAPLLAQCVAAEVSLPRAAGQLLACVPGSGLAVAAAGNSLLLLSASPGGVQLLAALLECRTSIRCVAVSSVRGQQRQWAAAVEGGTAHFVPLDASGADPACLAGSPRPSATTVATPPGAPGWEAVAWHPAQPVCALLAPHELLLVAPTGDPGAAAAAAAAAHAVAGAGSSDSEGEEGAAGSGGRKGSTWGGASTARDATWGGASVLTGDWGLLTNVAGSTRGAVLLALQGPAGSSSGTASGRCCLAWLDAGPSNSSGNCAAAGRRRLVVSWGGRLELLVFSSESESGPPLCCLLWAALPLLHSSLPASPPARCST